MDNELNKVNQRLDKMQKEDLFVLKSQMDRIENGDLPVIKSIVTNIDSRLERYP